MVGSNKILTVSYGTFSCTLEGFDDPFNTMRSIAEYFRDLAADDRYFGAEPPTPDADMLHRIAEREIQKRVEARVEDKGVVLRQMTAPGPEAAPAPAPQSQPTPQPRAAAPVQPQPAAQPEAEPVGPEGDSVAAKLARIRAAVARAKASREAATFEEDEPTEATALGSIDAAFSDAGEAPESVKAEPQASAPAEDETESRWTSAEVMADQDAPEAQFAPAAEAHVQVDEQPSVQAEDVQADEQAAFQAEEEAPVAQDAAYRAELESELDAYRPAGDEDARTEEPADAHRAELEQELDAYRPAVDEDTQVDAPEVSAEAYRAELEQELDAYRPDEAEERAAPAPVPSANVDAIAQTIGYARDFIDEFAEEAGVAKRAPAASTPERDTHAAPAEKAEAHAEAPQLPAVTGPAAQDEEEIEVETEEPDENGIPRARIIRLTRSEFEAALAAGDIEAVEDDEEAPAEPEAAEQQPEERPAAPGTDEDIPGDIREIVSGSSLPPEDEQELMAELAQVEREAEAVAREEAPAYPALPQERAEDADRPADRSEPDEATAHAVARRERGGDRDYPVATREAEEEARVQEERGEEALDRLITTTNKKLDEPQGTRRRSAIAHLKAAVAATRADRLLRGHRAEARASAMNQYRDDLAKVVRPRRPHEAGHATARPSDPLQDRPAPLMLVSELRVDRERKDEAQDRARPVQPRRVAKPAEAEVEAPRRMESVEAGESFAEFAERVGATELPDILEAAAAYATLVEGRQDVSRPQILRRAASITPSDETSRERGLKSFGQLLRSGRIRKVGAGRFAVADDTRYASAMRIAGE